METYLKESIKNDVLRCLTETAKDYTLIHGISMRVRDLPVDAFVPLSFALLPSPFPSYWFHYAKSIQTDLNAVIHNVAYDNDFLKNTLKSTIAVDDFTAKLFHIHETIIKEGIEESPSLGLLRSDYLLNIEEETNDLGLKQVEINAIASGLGGVSPQFREFHRYVLSQLKIDVKEEMLPINPSTDELAKGLYAAWEAYGNPDAVILFLVEDVSYNISDQRLLEFCLFKNYQSKITVIRSSFTEMRKTITMTDRNLFIKGKEISVVYYRTGYDPTQYCSEDWEARLTIERSKAIKCPSVRYQLAGTKKIQQELSRPGVLEKYLPDPSSAEKIRKTFAKLYSLDLNEEGDTAVAMALETPEKFVMKPQREGGGNNVYDKNIETLLKEISCSKQREGYILMEYIKPPSVENYIIVWNKEATPCQLVSELGIFGVILGNKDKILQNYEAGHLLRSKRLELNEGGVASGFGALDSPFLI